jgi:hypothetical protein
MPGYLLLGGLLCDSTKELILAGAAILQKHISDTLET